MKNFESQARAIDDYEKISRAKFASLVVAAIDGAPITNTDKKWIDEMGEYKDAITTLRVRYRFVWKDQFAERYFQVNKSITVGEGMYMMAQVL